MQHSIYQIARDSPYPAAAFEFVERGLSYTVAKIHGELSLDETTRRAIHDAQKQSPSASPEEGLDDDLEADLDADLEAEDIENTRHITGRDLCYGLRDFATQQYGLLAKGVLRRWQIHRTEDFGAIVFALVENNILRKTENDSIEDFINVFDFNEAFGESVAIDDSLS